MADRTIPVAGSNAQKVHFPETEISCEVSRQSTKDTISCRDETSSFTNASIARDNGSLFIERPQATSSLARWAGECLTVDASRTPRIEASGYCIAPTLTTEAIGQINRAAQQRASTTARMPTQRFEPPIMFEQQREKSVLAFAVAKIANVPPALILATLYTARMKITPTNLFAPSTWRHEISRPEFVTQWRALRGNTPISSGDPLAKILAIGLLTRRTLDNIGLGNVDWTTDVTRLGINAIPALRLAYNRPADTAAAKEFAATTTDASMDDMHDAGLVKFADYAEAIQRTINGYRQAGSAPQYQQALRAD